MDRIEEKIDHIEGNVAKIQETLDGGLDVYIIE